jgi:hypothetical protein
MSDELLERIAEALERIVDVDLGEKLDNVAAQLDTIQIQLEELGGHRPAAITLAKPPLPASAEDISRAVATAVQETHATSLDHMGIVIKAARGRLRERRFEETELQSMVRQVLEGTER